MKRLFPLHPTSNLSATEKDALVQGLTATLGGSAAPGGAGGAGRKD